MKKDEKTSKKILAKAKAKSVLKKNTSAKVSSKKTVAKKESPKKTVSKKKSLNRIKKMVSGFLNAFFKFYHNLSRKVKGIAYIVFAVIAAIAVFFGIINFTKTMPGRIIDFSERSTVSYRVHLKEVGPDRSEFLGSNMAYISTNTDYIEVTFGYELNSSEPISTEYTYEIVGKLTINDTETKANMQTVEYPLVQKTAGNIENSVSHGFNKVVRINFNEYNNIVTGFNTRYGITTNSAIRVALNLVKTNGVFGTESKEVAYINIPLAERTYAINNSGNTNKAGQITESDYKVAQSPFFYVGVILAIFVLVMSIYMAIKNFTMIVKGQSEYQKEVNKITKTYDRLIAEISTTPIFKGCHITEVANFKELVDIRDNLKIPIMHYEVKANTKCQYFIRSGTEVYMYTISKKSK